MKNKYEEGKGPLIYDNKCLILKFPYITITQSLRMPES